MNEKSNELIEDLHDYGLKINARFHRVCHFNALFFLLFLFSHRKQQTLSFLMAFNPIHNSKLFVCCKFVQFR